MESVTSSWDDTDDDDVSSYTDTDLTYSRNWSTRLYDPTGEYRDKATAIVEEYGLKNISATVDFATRVAIASLIDDNEALITRDEYDVSYTIPPRGWVTRNVSGGLTYSESEQVNEYIQTSMPPVCREMAEQLVEDGTVETKRKLMEYGIDLIVGE